MPILLLSFASHGVLGFWGFGVLVRVRVKVRVRVRVRG